MEQINEINQQKEAMEAMKACTRCGRVQSAEEFYKVKYKGRAPKYSYSVCRTCMSIEQRRRYLQENDPTSPTLAKIEALYEKHRAAGRSTPDTARRTSHQIEDTIDAMLEDC